jgi:hypothetical protein
VAGGVCGGALVVLVLAAGVSGGLGVAGSGHVPGAGPGAIGVRRGQRGGLVAGWAGPGSAVLAEEREPGAAGGVAGLAVAAAALAGGARRVVVGAVSQAGQAGAVDADRVDRVERRRLASGRPKLTPRSGDGAGCVTGS